MRYGCRAHDYGCFSAEELARVLKNNGYNAAQLAMPKAIQGIQSVSTVTPEQLEEIRRAFTSSDIEITVLSCYQDLSNPDSEVRENAVATVSKALYCQKVLGARHVGSESSCRYLSEEEKKAELPLLTDSVLRIVEQAAKLDTCFALEPVYVHALGTVEALRVLKETVADPAHFHVIFDPVNVLTRENVQSQDKLWPVWCETIGKDLAAVHMKDVMFRDDGSRRPTALGKGQMDYTVLQEWICSKHSNATLLRDEVILSDAPADLKFMQKWELT